MKKRTRRAAALVVALAFCMVALPGCPDDDDDDFGWAIGINADPIPGDGNNGDGLTAVFTWDWKSAQPPTKASAP